MMKQKSKNKFNIAYKKIEVITLSFVLILAYAITSVFAGDIPKAEATVPLVMNFQGKLTKVSDGTNVSNASYAFRFKLYDSVTSGTLLWTETFDQPSGSCAKLAVTNGVFNAKLGSCASLSGVDFSGGSVYLSVDYAPTGTSYDGEMSPRKQLLSSAFAILANGVNGNGGVRNTISSTTALAIAKAGTDYALQVDTSAGSAVTGLKVTSNAATSGLALNVISSGTNEDLIVNAKGSGLIKLLTSSTGNLAIGSTGQLTVTNGGTISTTGNISTTSSGTITSAGLLTGQLGLTVSGAAVSLNDSSNFGVSIAGGTSTGTITLGGTGASQSIQIGTGVAAKTIAIGNSNDDTFSIASSAFTVSTAGAVTGVTTLSASNQITSTLATGTAPFVVASTTNVANLNASSLNGATFASPGSIGSTTPGSGAFTTLTSSGATTLGTGSSLTNTFGSGASSINTIGSSTTPGTLTLRGSTIVAGDANTTAFTLGNVTTNPTFSLLGTGLTTLGGNLTVTGTAWTATPTISGLITATSGLTSNGTLTVGANQNLTMSSGTGVFSQTSTSTTTNPFTISATALTTGVAQALTLGTALTTGGALSVTGANYNQANGNTGNLLNLSFTQGTTTAGAVSSTVNGILLTPTINTTTSTSGVKTINGIKVGAPTLTACTGGAVCTYTGLNVDTSGTLANTTIYSALFNGGNVGIGTTGPNSALEINSATGNNLRLTYNDNNGSAANYTDFLVSSVGSLSIKPTGTLAELTLNPDGFVVNLGDTSLAQKTALRFYEDQGNGGEYTGIQADSDVITSYTWTLPASDASGCIQSNGAGALSVASCGGTASLQTAYNGTNTITTTNARNIAFTFADTATDQSLTLTQQGTATAAIFNDTNGATNTAIDIQSGGVSKLTITELGTISTTGNISTTSSGTITSAGLLTGQLGLTVSGAAVSLNDSSNFGVSIAGGTSTGTITLGGTGASQNIQIGTGVAAKTIAIGNSNDDTFSIASSAFNVSTSGALSGVTTLALTGAITGATGFNGLVVTANTGVVTTGTWNATAIGAQYGGTGIATNASSGLPSINSGTWSVNTITQNGVAFGGASNAMSFTSQGAANTVLVANAGAPSFSAAITVGTSVSSPAISGTTSVTTPLLTNSSTLALTTSASNANITLTPNGTGSISLTSGTTTGTGTSSALSLTTSTATSGTLLNFNHTTSAFTGTVIAANIANASGSFASGNFIDLQANSSSKFSVASTGAITSASLTSGGTQCLQATSAGLVQGTGSACGGAGGSRLDQITAATATNGTGIDSANFGQIWKWTTATTQTALLFNGGTAMTTGSVLGVSTTTYNHGSATETGNLINIAFTDATNGTATSTTNGINLTPTINVTTGASGTKTINGIKVTAPTLTACTGGSACIYTGLNVDTTGTLANTTIYAALFNGGNVGIGATAPTQKLEVSGTNGAQLYASSSNSTVITSATNWLRSPTGSVTVFIGDSDSTSGYTANQLSSDIRFNGTNVAWGDFSYYPNGGTSGNQGNFRLSTTGSAISTTPSGKLGVGELYSVGSVGIGDTSPNSLFTVGSGDLFQINTTGQISSQQAPVSDYLFALAGTSANDHSRIIDITQADNANEDISVINVANTASAGSYVDTTRSVANYTSTLTLPTTTISSSVGSSTISLYDSNTTITNSAITIGNTTGSRNYLNTYGQYTSIVNSPIINDTVGGADVRNYAYGSKTLITGTPTYTSIAGGGDFGSFGLWIDDQTTTTGNAGVTYNSYGVLAQASGNLTTTGNNTHYGGYFSAAGTADVNYGLYSVVSGGTANYAGIFTGGNVGIGTTAPAKNLEINNASGGTLRLTYNASANLADLSVDSSGNLTLDSSSNRTIIATGDFLKTSVSGATGAAAGDIWYDTAALKYKINENGTTKILCNTTDAGCGAGGSTAFDTIADPSGNGAINMGTTSQTLDWGATTTTDNLSVTSSATGLTSGSAFKVTSSTTGAVSNGIVQLLGSANFSGSGGLFNATANSTTAGVVAKFSGTSLTTGTAVSIIGGSSMTTGSVLSVSSTFVHASAETGSLNSITVTDNSSASSGTTVTNGSKINITASNDNSAGTGIVNGLSVATTIDTTAGGVKQINALNIETPTLTGCATGACTFAGLRFTGGTGSLSNLTSYGLLVDAGSGSGTEYAAAFTNGYVGIGTATPLSMLQVGSSIGRGDLNVYGDITTQGLKQLTTLGSIKDVYIYDTTADADGGRWVDWVTTEQLSWYTESKDDGYADSCVISSDDRCGASAFPRKAALVVTADSLYIFDATNNKMWMKFSQNASGYALGIDTNNDPSSVTALNGVVYVGTNGSASKGLYAFDFVTDRMWNYDDTDRSGADLGIGSRNSAITYNSDNNTNFDIATTGTIADWIKVNDVSVAVLKQSLTPIAAATGPNNGTVIVALATDSGLTTINLSTQKVNQYSDATDNDYNSVAVTSTGRLYGLNEALGQAEEWRNIDTQDNIATRVNGTPDKLWDEASTPALSKSAPTIIAAAPDALEVIERGSLADGGVISTAAAPGSSDLIYVGTNQGLTEIHDHFTVASGWSKFYNITRQTPLMPATIRRLHTMDDASGNVTNNSNKTSIMTAKGTPTYGVEGVRGKAMTFNGTSQYLCSDSNSDGTCDNDTTDNLSTGSWTITTWFKHSTTASGTDVLFSRCYNTTPAAAAGCVAAAMTSTGLMGITVDFDATFSIGAATNNTVYHQSVRAYNDNQWHFLSITRAATTGNVNTMIDGVPIGQTAGVNTTLDASQILSIGADCSVGAACGTGANFWDGQVDDFTLNANGSTGTDNNLTVAAMHRLYNDARPLLSRRVITVTDATSATSTTIVDTGETWIPNEFGGQIVMLTGGTGAGQSRRIVSNTTTSLTVSPAWATTPDTTTDFKIDPEALMGATNSVTSIGVTGESLVGEARLVCAGTNDASDGGGVTCFNHNAGPNIVADYYDSGAKKLDDFGTEWTGSGYDNIVSVDLSSRNFNIASASGFWEEDQPVTLGQGLDYLGNKLFDVRSMLLQLGTGTLAGGFGQEVGLTGGADLAEYYYSTDPLNLGDVVVIDPNSNGDDVLKSTKTYSNGLLGVVSTEPGLVLGAKSEDGYAIALTGRIPVKFSNENGPVQAGDYLTSSSIPGHAMRATGSGPTIGKALEDSPSDDQLTPCFVAEPVLDTSPVSSDVTSDASATSDSSSDTATSANNTVATESTTSDTSTQSKCGKVNIFAEHGYFEGLSIDQIMKELEVSVSDASLYQLPEVDSVLIDSGDLTVQQTKQQKILSFLKQMKANKQQLGVSSQILTDRLSASFEVITPSLVADGLDVLNIGTAGKGINVLADLTFIGRPYFNSDTGGFAKILAGDRFVDIVFDRPYLEQPTVTAMITQEEDSRLAQETDQNIIDNINVLNDSKAEELFGSGLQYIIIRKNVKGFRIMLNKPISQDVTFSWIAIAVKTPRLVVSEGIKSPPPIEENTEPVSSNPSDPSTGDIVGNNPEEVNPPADTTPPAEATPNNSEATPPVPDSTPSEQPAPSSSVTDSTGLE